jgi:alkanesulfonate monooxygenase SsuD/methylene tetrahydromethanopterin reductase-like flavin-dependent oxidoreductase (luciferase family)
MIVSLSLITNVPLPTIGRSIGDDAPLVFRGAPRKTSGAAPGEDSNGTNGEYCSGTDTGDVLDDNLYTAPGKYGGGGAGTTWLVGSADDVARSLRRYQELGITHFVLSDTPYLTEISRQGNQLLPLLRNQLPR